MPSNVTTVQQSLFFRVKKEAKAAIKALFICVLTNHEVERLKEAMTVFAIQGAAIPY